MLTTVFVIYFCTHSIFIDRTRELILIKVNVELSDDILSQLRASLAGFSGKNGSKIMPGTSRAFSMAAKLIQKSWQNWAMGGSLIGANDIKNPNSRLASSIHIRRMSDFDISIETDSRYMERIQNGSPEFDMKTKYPYGKKSRVTQSGKNRGVPYLIIPFRWVTPNKDGSARAHFGNTIPLELYKILKSRKFSKSQRTESTHIKPNASGENIERSEYTWGDRITVDDVLTAAGDEGISDNVFGMVKMKAKGKSTYFTFRVISANSPPNSWKRKAVPPNDVISAVEKTTKQNVEDILQAGLEQDLGV